MYASRQDYTLATGHIFGVLLACDGQDLKWIPCECLTQCFARSKACLGWVSHYLVQIISQVGERVRVAVGEVDSVILVLKVECESMCVVGAEYPVGCLLLIFSHSIHVVADFGACSMPANVF